MKTKPILSVLEDSGNGCQMNLNLIIHASADYKLLSKTMRRNHPGQWFSGARFPGDASGFPVQDETGPKVGISGPAANTQIPLFMVYKL